MATFPLETLFVCVFPTVLKLTLQTTLISDSEIRLPLPPKWWDKGLCHHTQQSMIIIKWGLNSQMLPAHLGCSAEY